MCRALVWHVHDRRAMRWIAGAVIATWATAAAAQPAPHAEYAVRAGLHDTTLEYDDDAPSGRGPLVEAEVGWRFQPWLSLAAFGAFSHLRDSFQDPFQPVMYTSSVTFVDLGLRFSVHTHGAFVGLGIAEEERHFGSWERAPFAELHAGFTFPRIEALHGAPQALVLVGRSVTDQGYYVNTIRLAIGVQF